jgi:UDP-glucose 4-epimerase
MRARRILITGLSSQLGGRLAQALEREPELEAIIGVDTDDPRHELRRTEFVRVGLEARPLHRIITAAAIDTVVDTRLIADPLSASLSEIHAVNVTGTSELLAACADSPARQLVFKSSANAYGHGPGQPAFLTEDMVGAPPPSTAVQRQIQAAERAVAQFGSREPRRRVATLRVADEIGVERRTSLLALLGLPVVPGVLGFDPRFAVIHFDDVVGALAHAVRNDLRGPYNVAADGVLVLSEIASLLGKALVPVLPPWGTGFAAAQLRRLRLRVPVEMLRQLRYGRGLDNRRLKATGYHYAYTSREAIERLRADQRLRPLLGRGPDAYRYQPDVEEFLRWSPSVRTAPRQQPAQDGSASAYDRLGEAELIDLIASLDPDALHTLRLYEAEHRGRAAVLDALDDTLARKRS